MKKNTFLRFVLIAIIIAITALCIWKLLLMAYFVAPWAVPWMGYVVYPNPGKPEVTHGEFPFKIVYELQGEIYQIEDTVICDYTGIELSEPWGKRRTWELELQSGNEQIILLDVSDQNITDEAGYLFLYLYWYPGNAEFYMGDDATLSARSPNSGVMIECVKQRGDVTARTAISTEEAWDRFGIRIIDIQWSEPVTNQFQ